MVKLLRSGGIRFTKTANPAADAATLIADQKIVAWFQGRMEFGPRALGARSLLADPSTENMRTRINQIKRREQFRPFGPSVLAEHMPALFAECPQAPFMSFTVPTTHSTPIIAATHIDGTSRPQTVTADGSGSAHPSRRRLLVDVDGSAQVAGSMLAESDVTQHRSHTPGASSYRPILPLTKPQVQVERPQRSEDVRPGPAASSTATLCRRGGTHAVRIDQHRSWL